MKRNHLTWIGPLVTFGGGVSYFLYFARFPDLRDFPWVNLPLVLLGTALSALAVARAFGAGRTYRGRVVAPLAFLFSFALCALFCFYVFSLSYRLPEASGRTLALAQAPDLGLGDHRGRTVSLADYRGRKLVVTFYRGYW